jgi:hypothetical protein
MEYLSFAGCILRVPVNVACVKQQALYASWTYTTFAAKVKGYAKVPPPAKPKTFNSYIHMNQYLIFNIAKTLENEGLLKQKNIPVWSRKFGNNTV